MAEVPVGDAAAALAAAGVPIAEAEGFPAHAASMAACVRIPARDPHRPISPQDRRDRRLAHARPVRDGRGHALDRRRLLRPHARPARPPRPARPRRAGHRRPADRRRTTRSRTPGSCSGRRWTRRSATGAGSTATGTPSCRWTRRARRARSTSPAARTRCSSGFDRLPAGDDRRLRARGGRGVLPRRGERRAADAAPRAAGRHERATT